MRLLFALVCLASASASAQPGRPLSFPKEPLHDSAARAYLYSAAATVGTVGVGYLLSEVLPEGDPTRDTYAPRDVGYLLMGIGVVGGPAVGNLTLAAGDDVARGLTIRVIGMGVATAGLMGTLVVCLSQLDSGCSPEGDILLGVAVAGLAGGLIGGTVYDLATIPANARDARERLRDPGSTVTVGMGAHAARPVLAVRVGL